jgi:hypothetical protein
MFSHVVIFWTKSDRPAAAEALLAGCREFLASIPGVESFHCGRMVHSQRPVVDQSYQVGLNLVFRDQAAQDAYQEHPLHLRFVKEVFQPNCERCVVYDFT